MISTALLSLLAAAGAGAPLAPPAVAAPVSVAAPSSAAVSLEALLGRPAPDWTLPDQNNATHTLSAQRGKWVVLAFFPVVLGHDDTAQNRSLSQHAAQIEAQGAALFAISTQDTTNLRQFAEIAALSHRLLSDKGRNTAAAYGALSSLYGFARRMTIYIAPDGTVAHVDTAVRPATAGPDAVATLNQLVRTGRAMAASKDGSQTPLAPPVDPTPLPVLLAHPASGAGHHEETGAKGAGPAAVRPGDRINGAFDLMDVTTGEARTVPGTGIFRATVIVFTSIECPCSNAYNARLNELADRYTKRGVLVVGVNANASESQADVADHARRKGLTFPVVKDGEARLADALGATRTPEVVILDKHQRIVYRGRIDDDSDPAKAQRPFVVEALNALLDGRPVLTPQTPLEAGCTIDRGGDEPRAASKP